MVVAGIFSEVEQFVAVYGTGYAHQGRVVVFPPTTVHVKDVTREPVRPVPDRLLVPANTPHDEYITCMSRVCHVYVTCMSCVCHVYVMCVCHVYVTCMACVCHVYVMCMSRVCHVCMSRVYVTCVCHVCMSRVCHVYVTCVCHVYVM